MNYSKLYYKFIESFKNQVIEDGEYSESHHILPRYCGGSDDEDNLVRLTYRQHVFVHHLWARATNDPQAWYAFKMMKGISFDQRKEYSRLGGLENVRSGHLDRIRELANTPERQRKLKLLNEEKVLTGSWIEHLSKTWETNTGRVKSEEENRKRCESLREKYENDAEYREKMIKVMTHASECRKDKCREYAKEVIENAQRNVEWLTKTSNRSENIFISPENLSFESPIYAAKYYGNVKPSVVENWCKRGQYGWKRIPKREMV